MKLQCVNSIFHKKLLIQLKIIISQVKSLITTSKKTTKQKLNEIIKYNNKNCLKKIKPINLPSKGIIIKINIIIFSYIYIKVHLK